MKKMIPILLILLLLSACGTQPTMETINDSLVGETPAVAKTLQVSLPENAAKPVMETDGGARLYDCGNYTLTTQTLPGGDLNGTLQSLTGFPTSDLAHMKTQQQGMDRYDCVWTTMGETGTQVCRGVILDDGNYHYAVTVQADATQSGSLREQWKQVLQSVTVKTD